MIRDFIPPFFRRNGNRFLNFLIPNRPKNKIIKSLKSPNLFSGDDILFKQLIEQSTYYAEVGCGQSTVYSLEHGKNLKGIVAIDSSLEWLKIVKDITSSKKLITHHSDFGKLSRWGKPKSYDNIDAIFDYTSAIFKYFEPDLVLIDGRFRVYCFLYTCLHGKLGLKILFDDYHCREHYKVVESVIKPVKSSGRQALFILNEDLNIRKAEELLPKFEYVME